MACLVRVFKYIYTFFFFFTIHKMVSPTLEFIVWLIFSKYNFQKTVSSFLRIQNKILKTPRGCIQDTKNVFDDIVVNKLKTVRF